MHPNETSIDVKNPNPRSNAFFGILNINKPAGRTSRRVLNELQRRLQQKKLGHAGTLDPLATGVLVVCLGPATRLIPYIQKQRKYYRATFQLGCVSDTEDVEGRVVEIADAAKPARDQLMATLPAFTGSIQQQPPAYSALKVGGRRAYRLARGGETPELAPRTIEIHRLQLVRYEYPHLTLDIHCGSGTYVRSLGRDIAASLGTGAVMSALERRAVGAFTIETALAPEQVSPDTLPQHLQSAVTAVAELARAELNNEEVNRIRHGLPINDRFGGLQGEIAATDRSGQLVALLIPKSAGLLAPFRTFRDSAQSSESL